MPENQMLTLDEFDDCQLNEFNRHIDDIITEDPVVEHKLLISQLLKGTLTEEKAGALLKELRQHHYEGYLNLGYHKNLHEDIDYDIIFYTCRIIAAGERDGASNIPYVERPKIEDFDKSSYRYWMWTLAQQMPIWRIVKTDGMPMQENHGDYPAEWFGFYNSNGPEIWLCPQRIKDAIEPLREKGIHIDEKLLTAYVIIHLLAHAIMDVSNRLDEQGLLKKHEKGYQRTLTDNSDVLMEESLANMITLSYFVSFMEEAIAPDAKVAYGTVRELMSIQPLEHKFGLRQFDMLRPDWREWREYKKGILIYETE